MNGGEGLQLLSGTKKRLGVKVPGENRFLYVGSAILGAVLVSMFALGRYKDSLMTQVDQLNNQISTLEERRNRRDEADLREIKDRLTITAELIRNHRYISEVFTWFEGMVQSEVQIEDISITPEGKFSFSAKAGGYIVVARQIAAFLSNPNVKDVIVGKMSSSGLGNVEFDMQLDLDLDNIILKN